MKFNFFSNWKSSFFVCVHINMYIHMLLKPESSWQDLCEGWRQANLMAFEYIPSVG